MYHRLGLKVYSPFFNMFELDKEYIEFLENAQWILKKERLRFCKMEYNQILNIDYPVYDLAGMKIYMNHYSDREKAECKWYERSGRINWDNLFIMMYSDNLDCIEKFAKLPFKKKVCFTSLHVDIPNAFYVPLEKVGSGKSLWQVVNGSAVGKYKLYDLIEMLNNGDAIYTNRIGWK